MASGREAAEPRRQLPVTRQARRTMSSGNGDGRNRPHDPPSVIAIARVINAIVARFAADVLTEGLKTSDRPAGPKGPTLLYWRFRSMQLYGFTVSSGRHTQDRFNSSGAVNVAGSVIVIS